MLKKISRTLVLCTMFWAFSYAEDKITVPPMYVSHFGGLQTTWGVGAYWPFQSPKGQNKVGVSGAWNMDYHFLSKPWSLGASVFYVYQSAVDKSYVQSYLAFVNG